MLTSASHLYNAELGVLLAHNHLLVLLVRTMLANALRDRGTSELCCLRDIVLGNCGTLELV